MENPTFSYVSPPGVSLFVSADRVALIEYASMTFPTEFGFIMRSPPLSYVSNIYRLAFTDAVWLCAILFCIVATLIIALTFKIRSKAGDELNDKLKMSDFVLLATASLCQMGSENLANKLSSKIAMVTQ